MEIRFQSGCEGDNVSTCIFKNRQYSDLERYLCTWTNSCLTSKVRCKFSWGLSQGLNYFSLLYIEKLFGIKNKFISAFFGEFLLFLPSSELERVCDIYCSDITAAPSSTAETIKITESNPSENLKQCISVQQENLNVLWRHWHDVGTPV